MGSGPVNTLIKAATRKHNELFYLAYFDPNTTCNKISSFVLDSFGFKSSYCVRLLRNDADVSILNFVSFKIAVPDEFKKNEVLSCENKLQSYGGTRIDAIGTYNRFSM